MADAWDQFPDAGAAPPVGADPWAAFPDATTTTPDLETLGRSANSEIAQQPEVAKGLGDRDLMSLITGAAPPAPPSQTDQQLAALGIPGVGTPTTPTQSRGVRDLVQGVITAGAQGVNTGMANIAGLPIDAINAAPMLANVLPGVSGVGPISQHPFGGSESIKGATAGVGSLFGAKPYEPQGPIEGVVNRVGQELGASALPVGGVLAAGARTGIQGARAIAGDSSRNVLSQLYGRAAESAAVDPVGLVRREVTNAAAAGAGAGVANEVVGAPQGGPGNFWSDLIGSITGVTALNVAKPIIGAGKSAVATVAGSPRFADDVAKQQVADAILDNSTAARAQFAANGTVDAQPLADQLRKRAPIEEIIPGYQADIAERSADPGLASFVYNQTRARPGAESGRRVANAEAVNSRIGAFEPDGNPGQFRQDLEAGRTERLTAANTASRDAQARFEEAMQRLDVQTTPQERGQIVRGSLQDALGAARAAEREAWAPVDAAGAVNPTGLSERFAARLASTPEPSQRSLPRDLLEMPQRWVPEEGEAATPLNNITALRSELQTEARKARSAGDPNAERMLGGFVDDIDNFLGGVPEIAPALTEARAYSRQLNDRFTRAGNPVADVLSEREVAGNFRTTDSEVPRRFVQSDRGRPESVDALLREADTVGQTDRVRGALREHLVDEVRRRGLTNNPDRLDAFLGENSQVFDRFPELRQEVASAGMASREARSATEAEAATTRDLTTPGRSPVASYLKYDDNRTVDAVRTVVNHAEPERAARELLDVAGRTPETLNNARSAFWRLLREEGQTTARDVSGNRQWHGRSLSDFLSEPKNGAVARVLYEDAPEQLDDMRRVFDTLATSDPATRSKLPNSSGTAQSLSGKFDPALSASSIASRARSINRGQLSPTIALIDLGATFLRRRSAQIQRGAIERLQDEVIQNPELAARLLEDYNPANYAAKRRQIMQKYGVRATQTINLLDEAHDAQQDPTKAKVLEGANGR